MTIGTLIATRVVASLAAAHIGTVVSSFLTGSIGAAGAAVDATKGKTGFKGVLLGGGGAMGLTLGAGVALTIISTGLVNFAASEVRMDESGKNLTRVREMVKSGEAFTPEGKKEVSTLIQRETEMKASEKELNFFESFVGTLAGLESQLIAGAFGGDYKPLTITEEEEVAREAGDFFGIRDRAGENTLTSDLKEMVSLQKQTPEWVKKTEAVAETNRLTAEKNARVAVMNEETAIKMMVSQTGVPVGIARPSLGTGIDKP